MKLRHKIALLVVLLQTTLITAVIAGSVRSETATAYHAMSSYGKMIAKVIAGRWITDIVRDSRSDLADLDQFVRVTMSFDDRIAGVIISDSSGKIIAGDINSRWVEFSGDKQAVLAELLKTTAGPKQFKTIDVNIESEQSVIGAVRIIFSLSSLRKQVVASATRWVLIGSCFIVIGIIGAFLTAKRITAPLSTVMAAMSSVASGDLNQSVSVRKADEVGKMAGAFNKMVEGLREREFVKDTFSKYVSKQVADRILREKDYLNLKGERRIVTVLFADIRGFTPLAEALPPEKVLDILNEYFSIMIDIVFTYGGVLNKFIGDAIMVTFNAPLDQKYHELRAIFTGLEIQRQIASINRTRIARSEPQINIGIGINTGEAVAGNVGSAARLEYTVIGSGVNLAQRIESSTEKGQLHISETTYTAVKDFVEVIKLEPVKVKGIAEPVQLYAVINAKTPEDFHENS